MVDETASSEFIQSALVEAEKVAKKQKTSAAKTNGVLHKALHQVEACLEHLRTHPDEDAALALGDLLRELEALDAVAQVSADTKELHGAVAKLGKVLDRGFSMDICVALRDPPLDRATLDRIVAEHLYQEGAFEVADAFVQEARVPGAAALKGPYVSMYAVVAELRKKNLAPAMAWADEHKAALRSPSGAPSKLVVSLHRLAFLQTLQQQGQLAAVAYARQHFKELYATHPSEVKRLMGMLCYAKRAASIKRLRPYEDLFGEAQWEGLVVDFKRQCCAMLGQVSGGMECCLHAWAGGNL